MEILPKEILVIIFKNLPQTDLLSITQVCTKFREIVEEFDLIQHLYISDKNDESSGRIRKYSKATVTNYRSKVHQRLLNSVGVHLTELTFFHCSLNLIEIAEIINSTPNVKSLTFDYVRLNDESFGENVERPQLQDVKLLFNESDPVIFRAIQKCSFVKVDLRFYANIPYSK